MSLRIPRFAAVLLLTLALCAALSRAQASESFTLSRDATSFDRSAFLNPETNAAIKSVGNLSGRVDNKDPKRALGWVEYDFSVPAAGWYVLSAAPSVDGLETYLDGDHYTYCQSSGDKIGNYWLSAGKHTLRLQRYTWFAGLGPVTKVDVSAASADLSQSVRVEVANATRVLRKGESLSLNIFSGARITPSTIIATVRENGKPEVVTKYPVTLPATAGLSKQTVAVPCTKEGLFTVTFAEGDKPLAVRDVPSIPVTVIDTTPQPRSGGEIRKTLISEIDCSSTAPDYTGGGVTRVVKKPLGSYRESNDVGWYGHMNSTDPSWFAYKVTVDAPNRPYVVEVDYPDDAVRSYCIAIREGTVGAYPTAGGVDSGAEFSLSNKMLTHSIIHWARTTDLRVLCITATSHQRAAASRIRVYRIDGDLPAMDVPTSGTRHFANWYEEGSNFMGVYGGGSSRGASVTDYITCADRWARSVAYMGGDTLWPTLVVYQFGLYPSHYNVLFGGPYSMDLARIILYACEKYQMHAIFEFHPEARELAAPPAGDNFLVNKNGVAASSGTIHFSPLHPRNVDWYMGMIGEFADQYKDSPAFSGVSLRQMTWQNPALNNFHSLDWGYEDGTIAKFERDTGLRIPTAADDPRRFEKRYEWLMANARERWITWRCTQIADLFTRIRDRVRKARPDLQVVTQYSPKGLNREAGVDPAVLGAIDGVTVMNGGNYGRRADMRPTENRDELLSSIRTAARKPNGESAFLIGSQYFEATEVVVPPTSLGFPESTPKTWMSGVVNPSGRHANERWAMALAEDDATFLSDGGNAYTLGQPVLREFLAEYRRLPAKPFTARVDATDPVAVRELRDGKTYWLYAVNRERYPVKVTLLVAGSGRLARVSTSEVLPSVAGTATLDLQPYQLVAFRGPSSVKLTAVKVESPEADVTRLKKQVAWLEEFTGKIARKEAGERLSTQDVLKLNAVRDEARKALDQRHLWQARIAMEHEMLPIYERANAQPPFLQDMGAPPAPNGALTSADLMPRISPDAGATLVDSASLSPDWVGDMLVKLPAKSWTVNVDVPVDGRYRLNIGHASGDAYGPVDVSVNGTKLGSLESMMPQPHGASTTLARLATLQRGKVAITFTRRSGDSSALSFLNLTPVFDSILSVRWMKIGPFSVPGRDGDKSIATVFPPETKRDFTADVASGSDTIRWAQGTGTDEFIDLTAGKGVVVGNVGYAVTHIYSPTARAVQLSYSMDFWAKMWMNGLMIEGIVPNAGSAPSKGQFTATTTLNAGWNELMVKLASGSGGDGFWLAVTNPGDLRFAAQVP
ncbi:MAG TPA: hypothetical protein VGK19_07345 [Capsulimonadaceae bacterium]|jgi:hypothetical protein